MEETCLALDNRLEGGQIVVICGRNEKLAKRLRRHKWASNVVILGFVSNMHEWMSASDCIVTKAGPGTIAESLACGLPIMLNNFIPCQEAGNIPWVIDNGVGDFSNEPEEVAWVREGEEGANVAGLPGQGIFGESGWIPWDWP